MLDDDRTGSSKNWSGATDVLGDPTHDPVLCI